MGNLGKLSCWIRAGEHYAIGNLKDDLPLYQSSTNLVGNRFQKFVWAREQKRT